MTARWPPTRSWSRPGPFQVPRVPAIAERLGAGSSSSTAPPTAARTTCRRGRCSSSAGGTRAFRSPRSSPPRDEVHLAIGSRQMPLPQPPRGRPVHGPDGDRPDDRHPRLAGSAGACATATTLVGSSPRAARRRGVAVRPRAAGARARPARSPTRRGSRSAPSSGRPASPSTTDGSTSPSSTPRARSCTSAASPARGACTSSGCRGSTPAAPRARLGQGRRRAPRRGDRRPRRPRHRLRPYRALGSAATVGRRWPLPPRRGRATGTPTGRRGSRAPTAGARSALTA